MSLRFAKNNWRNLVSSLTESFLVKYKYHRSSIVVLKHFDLAKVQYS